MLNIIHKKNKVLFIFFMSFIIISPIFAGTHPASQVLPGTFYSGDFIFDGNVNVSSGNDICIAGGNCLSSVVGVSDIWINSSGDTTGFLTSDLNIDNNSFVISYDDNNIGIGISTPTDNLHIRGSQPVLNIENSINGTSGAGGVLRFGHSQNNGTTPLGEIRGELINGNNETRAGDISFWTSTSGTLSERMRIEDSGQVGIKNTNPAALLHIGSFSNSLGTSAGNSIAMLTLQADNENADYLKFTTERDSAGSDWTTANWLVQRTVDATSMGYIEFGSSTSDLITFGEGSTEYMRIEGSGYVGIGITNPVHKLDVYSDAASGYAARFQNDGNDANRYGISITNGADSNAGTNYHIFFRDGDGTATGSITSTSGTVSYNPFTGSHIMRFTNKTTRLEEYGKVMCLKEIEKPLDNNTFRESIMVVEPCNKSYDKSAVGIYSGNYTIDREDLHQLYALGNGHVLVAKEGGDIEIGDYLTTSNTKGHAMKQDDDLLHSYTIAKSTEEVNWDEEENDTKLISCTYHAS